MPAVLRLRLGAERGCFGDRFGFEAGAAFLLLLLLPRLPPPFLPFLPFLAARLAYGATIRTDRRFREKPLQRLRPPWHAHGR